MSATAEKARYFLEQSIPELQDLSRKNIFSASEIQSIAKKRSDFEHKINARGSSPTDFTSYAEFESNVEALRKKRCKRLGIKGSATGHAGQRRIFFVFDRGTRKFPGDVGLWLSSIEYSRAQKSYKRVTNDLTRVLRLHPNKGELWIYAARFATEENGDVTEARGYVRRGLRFCRGDRELWVQNFMLEVGWVVKVWGRRRILGIEEEKREKGEEVVVGMKEDEIEGRRLADGELGSFADEKEDVIDVEALAKMDETPATSGAICIAVFDAAMTQFSNDVEFAFRLFEEVAQYDEVPAVKRILQHIDKVLGEIAVSAWQTWACHIALPMLKAKVEAHEMPLRIREMLTQLSEGLASADKPDELKAWCSRYLQSLLDADLDPSLRLVVESKLRSLM